MYILGICFDPYNNNPLNPLRSSKRWPFADNTGERSKILAQYIKKTIFWWNVQIIVLISIIRCIWNSHSFNFKEKKQFLPGNHAGGIKSYFDNLNLVNYCQFYFDWLSIFPYSLSLMKPSDSTHYNKPNFLFLFLTCNSLIFFPFLKP